MWLIALGVDGDAAPASFITTRIVASPLSPKIVGHGASAVHGAGVDTLVITSEVSVLDGCPGDVLPRIPWSDSITRKDGPRPWATDPHEVLATASTATTPNLRRSCIADSSYIEN